MKYLAGYKKFWYCLLTVWFYSPVYAWRRASNIVPPPPPPSELPAKKATLAPVVPPKGGTVPKKATLAPVAPLSPAVIARRAKQNTQFLELWQNYYQNPLYLNAIAVLQNKMLEKQYEQIIQELSLQFTQYMQSTITPYHRAAQTVVIPPASRSVVSHRAASTTIVQPPSFTGYVRRRSIE